MLFPHRLIEKDVGDFYLGGRWRCDDFGRVAHLRVYGVPLAAVAFYALGCISSVNTMRYPWTAMPHVRLSNNCNTLEWARIESIKVQFIGGKSSQLFQRYKKWIESRVYDGVWAGFLLYGHLARVNGSRRHIRSRFH
ncbi:hypothetical protein Zmor_009518 [Zophobas morio]|uniref:Uncharacterized protein n=1 Tax=Zophobas morio TaxID=2755281 RepID=A0AA38IQU3_9CUCU|nr:hypothetical protein Zmor_009518 [Zophobas morio]